MKTAVVFYTRDGNTKAAAHALSGKLGADIFELEEVKKRGSSPVAFMAAAFGALIGKKSKLKNTFAKEMTKFELICIGSPIWAAKATPAVNAFISTLDAQGKEIILFTLQADKTPATKGADILKKALEKKGAQVNKIIPLCGSGVGETPNDEDIKTQIEKML